MEKSKGKYVFHVLGGSTYSEKERPQFWRNEMPLLYDGSTGMKQLPLDQFPLIEDFQVILEDMRDTQEEQSCFGYHVLFYSPCHGYVASFPWWDFAEKDLCREDFSIPLGDLMTPF